MKRLFKIYEGYDLQMAERKIKEAEAFVQSKEAYFVKEGKEEIPMILDSVRAEDAVDVLFKQNVYRVYVIGILFTYIPKSIPILDSEVSK